jgi:hypothetical protein
MRLVTPEKWYVAWWACVWLASMVAIYFVTRYAFRWALDHSKTLQAIAERITK